MENEKQLVSVIVPCYNQAQYLPDALESILKQTYPDWECIIINDGSTDNTEEVTLEWISKDKRFKYFKKENGGLSTARNAGLKHVNGHFIQFLDSDDVIDSKKFETQIEALKGTPDLALSISDYFPSKADDLSMEKEERYMSPKFSTNNFLYELISNWETKLSIPVHCYLFKSNLFKDNALFFNETLANHEDWECWMNIFQLKPEVVYVDQKLATYRIHNSGMHTNKIIMHSGYLQAIEIQKSKFIKNTPEYILLVKKYYTIMFGFYFNHLDIVYEVTPFNKIEYLRHKYITNHIDPKIQDEEIRAMFKNRFELLTVDNHLDFLEDWQRNDYLIQRQKQQIEELQIELQKIEQQKEQQIEKLKEELVGGLQKILRIEEQHIEQQIEGLQKEQQIEELQKELDQIINSKSWIITKPFRFISRLFMNFL